MSKFTKIKLELARMLSNFTDLKTSSGVLTWDSDEDLRAGMDVYVQDENGEYKPAEDGEYVTEDGKTIVVKDGKVESVTDPKAEVDPEEAEAIEKHGLLIIKLPKLDKNRETKLKIKSI